MDISEYIPVFCYAPFYKHLQEFDSTPLTHFYTLIL
jgi:hypothetical protein